MELIRTSLNAFVLHYIIAMRAWRTGRLNRHNLAPGEAFLGDYESYGMTEGEYRTAKKVLQKHGLATFRTTNKGTIATITSTSIFDINVETNDGQDDVQNNRPATDSEQANNEQVTTNNNDNKGNKGKNGNTYRRKEVVLPKLDEVKLWPEGDGLPPEQIELFFHTYESRGWKVNGRVSEKFHSLLSKWKVNYEIEQKKHITPPTAPARKASLFELVQTEKALTEQILTLAKQTYRPSDASPALRIKPEVMVEIDKLKAKRAEVRKAKAECSIPAARNGEGSHDE